MNEYNSSDRVVLPELRVFSVDENRKIRRKWLPGRNRRVRYIVYNQPFNFLFYPIAVLLTQFFFFFWLLQEEEVKFYPILMLACGFCFFGIYNSAGGFFLES